MIGPVYITLFAGVDGTPHLLLEDVSIGDVVAVELRPLMDALDRMDRGLWQGGPVRRGPRRLPTDEG